MEASIKFGNIDPGARNAGSLRVRRLAFILPESQMIVKNNLGELSEPGMAPQTTHGPEESAVSRDKSDIRSLGGHTLQSLQSNGLTGAHEEFF